MSSSHTYEVALTQPVVAPVAAKDMMKVRKIKKGQNIVEEIKKTMKNPATEVCIRYNMIRQCLVPLKPWDVLLNTAIFAATVLGISGGPLQFLYPSVEGHRPNLEGWVPKLCESERRKLRTAFDTLEANYGKYKLSPSNANGGKLQWETFLRHLRLVRRIFAKLGAAVTEVKDKRRGVREYMYNQLYLRLRNYESIRAIEESTKAMWDKFAENFNETGHCFGEICAENRDRIETRTHTGRLPKKRVRQEPVTDEMETAESVSDNQKETKDSVVDAKVAADRRQADCLTEGFTEFTAAEEAMDLVADVETDEIGDEMDHEPEIEEDDRNDELYLEDTKMAQFNMEKVNFVLNMKPGMDLKLRPCKKAKCSSSKSLTAEEKAAKKKEEAEEIRKRKAEKIKFHQSVDSDDEDNVTEPEKYFYEALDDAGAKIYDGDMVQTLLFEQLMHGFKGSKGSEDEDWKLDADHMLKYILVQMSEMGMYTFGKSDEMFHSEIFRKAQENNATCLQDVIDFADSRNIAYEKLPGSGSHIDPSALIQVAHSDSDLFKEVTEDLRFDAPKVIRLLQSLFAKSKNGDDRAKVDISEERGTITCPLGFTDHAYNHRAEIADRDTSAPAPEMACTGVTSLPEHNDLRRSLGPLSDAMWKMQDRCVANQFWDERRHQRFGKKFQRSLGAKRSRYESCTVSLTELGEMGTEELREKLKEALKHRLKRHSDGPNDYREGYQHTCVFWTIVVLDGKVFRLAVIMYSRVSIGNCMQNEDAYMAKTLEEAKDFYERTPLYDDIEPPPENEWRYIYFGSKGKSFRARVLKSLADGMGYISGAISPMSLFLKEYKDIGYHRQVELLYTAMLCNCYPLFYYVVMQWIGDGEKSLKKDIKNGRLAGPSLVRRFYKDCEDIGCENGKVGEGLGLVVRFMFSDNKEKFGSSDEHEAKIRKNVNRLKKVLDGANENLTYEATMKKLGKLHQIGPMKKISFYSIATCCGYLYTPYALKHSFRATVYPQSPFGKKLLARGCKLTGLASALKQLAKCFDLADVTELVVENIGCKVYRVRKTEDCFIEGMYLFKRSRVSIDGKDRFLFSKKRFGEQHWTQYVVVPLKDDVSDNAVAEDNSNNADHHEPDGADEEDSDYEEIEYEAEEGDFQESYGSDVEEDEAKASLETN